MNIWTVTDFQYLMITRDIRDFSSTPWTKCTARGKRTSPIGRFLTQTWSTFQWVGLSRSCLLIIYYHLNEFCTINPSVLSSFYFLGVPDRRSHLLSSIITFRISWSFIRLLHIFKKSCYVSSASLFSGVSFYKPKPYETVTFNLTIYTGPHVWGRGEDQTQVTSMEGQELHTSPWRKREKKIISSSL